MTKSDGGGGLEKDMTKSDGGGGGRKGHDKV